MCVWPPLRAGTDDMMGARSTGPTVFSTKCAIAVSAPVLPALTIALRAAFLHEVDGDAHGGILAAADGLARMLGHADHGGRRMHGHARAHAGGTPASAGSMTAGLPTRISSRAGSVASARSAPGMHSGAPLSPLITSTAIDAMRYERGERPAPQLFFGLDFGRFFDDAFAAIETVRE